MIINYRDKFKNLITEGTYKQLANIIQQKYLDKHSVESYQELNDDQKQELTNLINVERLSVKKMVEQITSNIYYQSWIYDVLISGEQSLPEDYEKIDQAIKDFIKISRSSKLTPEQKDIKKYATFSDLHQFLYEFKQSYTQYKPLEFDLYYQNDKYAVYEIQNKDFVDFSKLITDLNIAWCVKQRSYFNNYGAPYYMIVNKSDNKPYALLHLNSHQIKDVHDRGLKDCDPAIIDVLSQFDNIDFSSGDLHFYIIPFLKKQNPDISDIELFCKVYVNFFIDDQQIISCKSKKTVEKEMLDPFRSENGSFSLTFNQSTTFANNKDRSYNAANLFKHNLLTPQQALKYILKDYCRENSDGTCDILVDVNVTKGSFLINNGKFITKINKSKSFKVTGCGLTSLENCPNVVDGYFDCSDNNITSLENGPAEVKYGYMCNNNPIKSLDNLPEHLTLLKCNATNIRDLHSNTLKDVLKVEANNNELLLSLNVNYTIGSKLDVSNCPNLSDISRSSTAMRPIEIIHTGCPLIK